MWAELKKIISDFPFLRTSSGKSVRENAPRSVPPSPPSSPVTSPRKPELQTPSSSLFTSEDFTTPIRAPKARAPEEYKTPMPGVYESPQPKTPKPWITPVRAEHLRVTKKSTPFQREKDFYEHFGSLPTKIVLDNVLCESKEDSKYDYDYIRMPYADFIEKWSVDLLDGAKDCVEEMWKHYWTHGDLCAGDGFKQVLHNFVFYDKTVRLIDFELSSECTEAQKRMEKKAFYEVYQDTKSRVERFDRVREKVAESAKDVSQEMLEMNTRRHIEALSLDDKTEETTRLEKERIDLEKMKSTLDEEMNDNEEKFAKKILRHSSSLSKAIEIYEKRHQMAMDLMDKGVKIEDIWSGIASMSGGTDEEIKQIIAERSNSSAEDIRSLEKMWIYDALKNLKDISGFDDNFVEKYMKFVSDLFRREVSLHEFIEHGMCMETEDQTYGRFWPVRKNALAYTFIGIDRHVYKVFKPL